MYRSSFEDVDYDSEDVSQIPCQDSVNIAGRPGQHKHNIQCI